MDGQPGGKAGGSAARSFWGRALLSDYRTGKLRSLLAGGKGTVGEGKRTGALSEGKACTASGGLYYLSAYRQIRIGRFAPLFHRILGYPNKRLLGRHARIHRSQKRMASGNQGIW